MNIIQIEKRIKKILEQYTDMDWEDIDPEVRFTDLDLNFSNDTVLLVLLTIDSLWALPLSPEHLSVQDFISVRSLANRILYLQSLK